MRRLGLAMVLAACGSKSEPPSASASGSAAPKLGGDCKLVLDAPAGAVAELTKRYPGEPVKVAEIIERCVAPDGDECARIDKLVKAIPAMMPTQLATAGADYRATCRSMPEAARRCLLPSYVLAHPDECEQQREVLRSTPIDQISITPSQVPLPPRETCDELLLQIEADGAWLGSAPDARCYAPHVAGELDRDWLREQLAIASELCRPAVSVVGTDSVRYQDVITAMDALVQAGYPDVGLASPDAGARIFGGARAAKPGARCKPAAKRAAMATVPPPRSPASPQPPADSRTTLQNAPVIIVTRDEVSVTAGTTRHPVGRVAELARGTSNIDALTRVLPASGGLVILQADASTPAPLVNRIVVTARAAGYDNVMFAVKKP